MKSRLIRFEDWTNPVPPVRREVISVLPDKSEMSGSESGVPGDAAGAGWPGDAAGGGRSGGAALPPVLFVGTGYGNWLKRAAERGFPAHALTPRAGGDLRAHVHDVVQTAAGLPRQAVLIGHGVQARVVAHALGRYPARAFVLASPVLDGWATLGAALRANPIGAVPALFGGRLRLNSRQLFGAAGEATAGQAGRGATEAVSGQAGREATATTSGEVGAAGRGAAAYTGRWRRGDLFAGGPPPRPVGRPPGLVLGSPDDRVVPRASLDRTAARYGGAPLLFPGMGHALTVDAAWAEPIDAICDWLVKELSAG